MEIGLTQRMHALPMPGFHSAREVNDGRGSQAQLILLTEVECFLEFATVANVLRIPVSREPKYSFGYYGIK